MVVFIHLLLLVSKIFVDFKDAMQHQLVARLITQPIALHQEAPPPTWVKVNWDVAIKNEYNKIGIGVIIRDCSSSYLANLMQPMLYCVVPRIA